MTRWIAMAIGAHPDDIEFMMAGTLLRLKQAGAEIHMWNLANGCCGSMIHGREEIARLRQAEAEASARAAGAILHRPIADDLAVYYEPGLLAKTTAVIRQVKPNILLIPSPQDYMEDHTNTCRLAAMAAFVRGVPNYPADPPQPAYMADMAVYHAEPFGLHDCLRQLVLPSHFVDVSDVMAQKRSMLSMHVTQKDWLDATQGLGAYVEEMDVMCREVGAMSRRFAYAEGWRLRLHRGYAAETFDPLRDLLGERCLM